MLNFIIDASIRNRTLVLVASFFLFVGGYYAAKNIPIDAIPDLSDVQVIVYTEYPGQAPQVVEDQVTYPLTTAMLSVPHAKNVRGFSFFGLSFVYIIFEDGTDLYWARSRVLEYLNYAAKRLPPDVTPGLGPDATGVGWIYQYALIDKSKTYDLSRLRSIQDWFLRFELQAVNGVSEVASIGGFVRQYQVRVDPNRLAAHNVSLPKVIKAISSANKDVGGRLIEMAETEYMVRGFGYFKNIEDIKNVVLSATKQGTPIKVRDVAEVNIGPAARRGLAELNGEGETVGGIVVMRYGENALATIERVKEKLASLSQNLPVGIEIVEVYDRSTLIMRAVDFLKEKLIEESVVVALICVIFLLHLRSALVAIVILPLSILISFVAMSAVNVNANIMSLGGVAIAIGALVDAAVVMIENAHKRLEQEGGQRPRIDIIIDAAKEVGPALFFCLLIITLSFLPVFALEDQEGRLFKPMAFTKTFAMAAASFLAITLTPVLMVIFIRGDIAPEKKNPINIFLLKVIRPVVAWALDYKKLTLLIVAVISLSALWPASKIGGEFMPPLNEGDILYMPTTPPGISVTKAKELLQQTDKIIRKFPEVDMVFGKVGRAETATDPAPLSMIETIIRLKPEEKWRPGMTLPKLINEMDQAIQFPGLTNAWTMPIKARIDMLSTGIKTPVGLKVIGPDLEVLGALSQKIESVLKDAPNVRSVYAERVVGGKFLDYHIDRDKAARYGLNVEDVAQVIKSAIGGVDVTSTVEGVERYPVNVRYQRELRDNLAALSRVLISTPNGQQIPISQVAEIKIDNGAAVIKSENTRPVALIYIDLLDADVTSFVANAKQLIADKIEIPSGVSLTWSGQFEYIERAKEKLALIIPLTLGVIFILLFLNFGAITESLLVLLTAPLSAVGGIFLLALLGYDMSVAVIIGFIALAGVAAEIGVLILVYINHAIERRKSEGRWQTKADIREAVLEGVSERIRPIIMTVCAIIGGLAPIMFGHGTGAEVMKRIAAPMVGGMVSVTLLSLVALPALYCAILESRRSA